MKAFSTFLPSFHVFVLLGFSALTTAGRADIMPMPSGFKSQMIATPEGAELFVRSGGTGSPVILLHGFGDTGDMWGPLAVELAKDHLVIVPDLRGMGKSSHPAGGYDKKTQATDIRAIVPDSGHWVMDENPAFTVALVSGFLREPNPSRQPAQ